MEIPRDMPMDEVDRKLVEEVLADRRKGDLDGTGIPSERVHSYLVELQKRFAAVNSSDQAIAREMLANLKKELAK